MRKLGLFLVIFILSVTQVLAQDSPKNKEESPAGSLDLRFGWLGREQNDNFGYLDYDFYDFGFKVRKYSKAVNRLSLYYSFDYLGGGNRTIQVASIPNPGIYRYSRISEFALLPNIGLEADLIRLPHLNFSVHGGEAMLISRSSINTESFYVRGDSYGNNDLVVTNSCSLPEYAGKCGFRKEFLANAGWNLRFSSHRWKKDSFYAGTGYTYYSRMTRQFYVFVGGTF